MTYLALPHVTLSVSPHSGHRTEQLIQLRISCFKSLPLPVIGKFSFRQMWTSKTTSSRCSTVQSDDKPSFLLTETLVPISFWNNWHALGFFANEKIHVQLWNTCWKQSLFFWSKAAAATGTLKAATDSAHFLRLCWMTSTTQILLLHSGSLMIWGGSHAWWRVAVKNCLSHVGVRHSISFQPFGRPVNSILYFIIVQRM